MSTDRLTSTSPHELAGCVLAVIAGADRQSTAADKALEPAFLDEAVEVYKAAGLAALEQHAEHGWYGVRVEFLDWSHAETTVATVLGPRLDSLQKRGALRCWWFLRKHPCWRLRFAAADTTAVGQVLDEVTASGAITRWWPTVYEPEAAAFGGPAGMPTIHRLFCADSLGVLEYVRRQSPRLGRRELSLLLLSGLLHRAGLDQFECGDVFDRVAQLRPTPADAQTERIEQLADKVRVLLSIPDLDRSGLFIPGGPVGDAAAWLAAFQDAGHSLGQAATERRLERGVRAILTHVVIFHWNRLGLSAVNQGILARAATMALLPRR